MYSTMYHGYLNTTYILTNVVQMLCLIHAVCSAWSDIKIKNHEGKNTDQFPRILHHIYFGGSKANLPELSTPYASKRCIRYSSKFQHIQWDNDKITTLIRDHYSWFLHVYESYKRPIQKIDAARYFILHKYGGIYMDMDVTCRWKIQSLYNAILSAQPKTQVVLPSTKPFGYTNDILIARPGSEFFHHMISELESANRWYVLPYLTVMLSTGPMFLTKQIQQFKDFGAATQDFEQYLQQHGEAAN